MILMRSRHRIFIAITIAIITLLGACAGLPQRGAVTVVPKTDTPSGGVALDAKGPSEGATPEELIQGFLRAASAGTSDDYRVAREYLTPEAAARWKPAKSVSIFSDSDSIEYSKTSTGAVVASVPALASLDAKGRYIAATQGSTISRHFSLMINADGEWRIGELDDSVLISQTLFASLYVRAPLYFLNASSSSFVPEVRWYPRSRALAMMSKALISAPSEWLSKVAHSAFTSVDGKADLSVSVEAGVAQVDLPVGAASLKEQDLGFLQAQFTKTLVGSGLVQDVRLLAGGAKLEIPSVPDVQAYPYTTVPALAIQNGNLVSIREGQSVVLQPAAAFDAADFSSLAVDYSVPARWVVGENSERTALTQLATSDGQLNTLLEGTKLARPSIDQAGWLWTADADSPGALLAVNLQSGQLLRFNVPDLADRTIDRIAVSRENSRIVVAASDNSTSRMAVYGIERGDSGVPLAVGEPMRFGQSFANVRDIAWVSELRILVLGSVGRNGTQGLFALDIGGLRESVTGVPGIVALTAGRSVDSLLVMDSDGAVKDYSGSTWSDVTTGVTAIAFPG